MREALRDQPEAILEQPPGLVTVRIDPTTGTLAPSHSKNAIYESFRAGQQPKRGNNIQTPMQFDSSGGEEGQLF